MTALLGFILSNPTVIAILAGVIGIVAALFKGRIDGAAKERQKRTEERLKARDIADDIDDAVAGRAPAANREELKRWGK